MLLTEYNERKYIRMFRKEARAEGLAEWPKNGLKVWQKDKKKNGSVSGNPD